MHGEGQKETRSKPINSLRIDNFFKSSTEGKDNSGGVDMGENAMASLHASLRDLHTDIKAIRSDVKQELSGFKDSFSKQMQKDMASLSDDINGKLSALVSDLRETATKVGEAEQRVADVEEWGAEANEVLCKLIQDQERMQAKLTSYEMHAKRNNLRLYSVCEDSEGDSMMLFINNFIKTELGLDMDLGIVRCHRALAAKPPPEANPRSIVMCFQDFRIKELVRTTAWKKKAVLLDGKRVYFDNDWPPEIQKRRMAYAPIRHILQAKGISFHTPPPSKLRVFYEGAGRPTGPSVTYETPEEARRDLKRKGLTTDEDDNEGEPPSTTATNTSAESSLARLKKMSWTRVGKKKSRKQRVLQKFQENNNTAPPPNETSTTDPAT